MPAKSAAALAKKAARRKQRRAEAKPQAFAPQRSPGWRRLMPKMPNLTKSEMRAMFESAWKNTAET